MLIEDFQDYFNASANYKNRTNGLDNPESCVKGRDWWYDYPVQDFDYKYNSWGFRGPEYSVFVGSPVNICLGDSFTVNLGGPVEHSWCSILSKNFDIPTLNLGMDGAGNDAIKLVYDRACEIFDVQNTFVMYSYFHRRMKNNTFNAEELNLDSNIDYFNSNIITGAHYTFLPVWNWTNDELEYIHSNHKNNVYDLLCLDLEMVYQKIDKTFYNSVSGEDWVSWEDYVTTGKANEVMKSDELYNQILSYPYVNRDGHHCNQITNQFIADFLWSQYNAT